MKEHNRLRLERMTARYAQRAGASASPGEEEIVREFEDVRDRILRPAMEEIRQQLCEAGHAAAILIDEGPEKPSLELALGLRGGPGSRNVVGFCVIRWKGHPAQVLAYLEVNPPKFDLERFARPGEISADRTEQLLLDAVEHIMACNAP